MVIHNTSAAQIACQVDGYTRQSGNPVDWTFRVEPHQSYTVGINYQRSGPAVIDWADCQGLRTRMMNITPTSQDGVLSLNGQQNRVLNVALYPYLPTNPAGNFQELVAHVIATFQADQPQVLLNAVLNQDVDIYSYTQLPVLLGPGGFDVIELDTLYLGFLATSNLIVPATLTGDSPWAPALQASMYNGVLYGVPSWLCMDFVFAYDPTLKAVTSLTGLLDWAAHQPTSIPAMVGDFDGSWRLPSIYINAYVQQYGYANIGRAMIMPPDQTVIDNLVKLVSTCSSGNANDCIDGTYHSGPNGITEQVLATGGASADMGFSEQSFFIQLYGAARPLYIVPGPWGQTPQPLLYSDTFVTSQATCAGGTQCYKDSTAFTRMMTGTQMKTYIAYSQDLPAGTPPRHLLVATQPFWSQPVVQNDPVYQQVRPVLTSGQPFPTTMTAQQQVQIGTQVCAALQAQLPDYACTPPPTMLRREYRR